jgi:hypothetical protein
MCYEITFSQKQFSIFENDIKLILEGLSNDIKLILEGLSNDIKCVHLFTVYNFMYVWDQKVH